MFLHFKNSFNYSGRPLTDRNGTESVSRSAAAPDKGRLDEEAKATTSFVVLPDGVARVLSIGKNQAARSCCIDPIIIKSRKTVIFQEFA